jgi:glycosyltransferase involved in cell wall biosynthesis
MNHDPAIANLGVFIPAGETPQWIAQSLAALDALPEVRLHVHRMAVAPGPMSNRPKPTQDSLGEWQTLDMALFLDASSANLHTDVMDGVRVWAVVDADGAALDTQYPLLDSICSGFGIALQLVQKRPSQGAWRVHRTVHIECATRYAIGVTMLAKAVKQLARQSVTDWRLSTQSPIEGDRGGVAITPAKPARFVPLHLVGGATRASMLRLKKLFLCEFWRIGVVAVPIESLLDNAPLPPTRWLTPFRFAGYWADPCALPGEPTGIACEYFDEETELGRLEVMLFGDDMHILQSTPIPVSEHQHASFPHVVEIDGRQLALAETAASRTCVLYELDASGVWNRLYTILNDVAAVDPVLFCWEDRWWLAYTDADWGEQDNLCLQYADQLEGPWLPHMNNPVKVDVTSARMAGGVFCHQGTLYRPGQDCLRTYGAAVVVHRITQLSPTQFSEETVRRLEPDRNGSCPDGLHTLNRWGDHILIDGKCLKVNPVALLRKVHNRLFPKKFVASYPATQPTSRVMVYVPHLRTGGGEISMLRLAEGFVKAGLAVDLVVHSQTTCELPVPTGVHLINLECSGTLTGIWRLASLLRQYQPQWLLSAFPHTNIAAVAAVALSRTRTRCVLSEHAPLSLQIVQQGNWRYRVLPPLVRWAYRRAGAVVAVSRGVRDDLLALTGPHCVVQVINNPVLAVDFESDMMQTPTQAWLNDPKLQVILSVCRLSEEKDLPTVLHAFAQVHAQRPRARLILAGEGPERPHLEELVRQLGLSEWVRLPGRTNQALAWMRCATVFVLASRFEGFGNVLIEALACGTPVVSTDCPVGPRELLEDGRWGKLVPVGNARAMAEALRATLDSPEQPRGAREAARQYTQTDACAAYMQLFDRL